MTSIQHSPPKSMKVEVKVLYSGQRTKKLLLYTSLWFQNFWYESSTLWGSNGFIVGASSFNPLQGRTGSRANGLNGSKRTWHFSGWL